MPDAQEPAPDAATPQSQPPPQAEAESGGTSRIVAAYLRAHRSSMARSLAYRNEFITYGMVLLASTLITTAIVFRVWNSTPWLAGALAVHALILCYCSFRMYRFVRFALARYAQRLHEKLPRR